MARRKNPRLMPVSEDDVDALTHKAIQLAKSGLEAKVRQFQKSKDSEGKRRYPSKEKILEMPVGMIPYAMGRTPKSRGAGASILSTVEGRQNQDFYTLNNAGFTFTDVRGVSIDGLLSIVIPEKGRISNVFKEEINWNRLNNKTWNEDHDIYAYLLSRMFGEGSQVSSSREKGTKQKQVFLKLKLKTPLSFGDAIKALSVKPDSIGYDILFNRIKEVVLHEFIHAMESTPKEWDRQAISTLEEYFEYLELYAKRLRSQSKRRRRQLISKWKKNFPGEEIDPYGIYINEPKEQRAYLSQVLNEIVDYYQKKDGSMKQAFFTDRPETLAQRSRWLVDHAHYFYPSTESFFLSAIYQFQQEFDSYNLPRYQTFDATKGDEILRARREQRRREENAERERRYQEYLKRKQSQSRGDIPVDPTKPAGESLMQATNDNFARLFGLF